MVIPIQLEFIILIFSWEIIKRSLHYAYWWWEWCMGRADTIIIEDMKFRIRAKDRVELQRMREKIFRTMGE